MSEYRLRVDSSVSHKGNKSIRVVGIVATGKALNAKVRYELIPMAGEGSGKIYTVAFWAKVDVREGQSRRVDISVQMENDEWPGFYNKTITLDSTDWKEYTDTFTIEADVVEDIWVGLSVAETDIDFWVDDFRFFEGEPGDEIGKVTGEPNQVVNPPGKLPACWGSMKQ